jgi:preprotein translocase subunit SecF
MPEDKQSIVNTKNWYDRSYKLLLIIPVVIMLFSVIYLVGFYQKNGDIFYKDVSITGGTTITVFDKVDLHEVENAMKVNFPDVVVRSISDLRTGEQLAFFVETTAGVEEIKPALEEYLGYTLNSDNSSVEFTGASLSSSFYAQLRFAIILSFVLMAIVVFIIFRTPVRSLSIIIAGIAPIVNFFFLVNTKYKVMAFLAMLAGTGFIVIGCTNVLQ